jgi:aspartate kinase
MVAAIGSDISEPGLVPRALQALETAGVRVLAIQHQMRNVDVQFVIPREDFDGAVQALHAALIERSKSGISGRAAA